MTDYTSPDTNVQQAVPFFAVADMARSLHFYVDGLGFSMTKQWIDNGKLRWCWLEKGRAALMLQEIVTEGHDAVMSHSKLGLGVTIYFICRDALVIYHEARERGIDAATPIVGNSMWVTAMQDPDGYRIEFESATDVAEGTVFSETHVHG